MLEISELSMAQAYQQWQVQGTLLFDIRARQHFTAAHVSDTIHLTQDSWFDAISHLSPLTPILVICYHGISSQRVVIRLLQQGLLTVYNVQGGFECWAANYPETLVRSTTFIIPDQS
ncbi:MAG: rhodanese-like domain-containing protein [Candidatus Symbiodolus clandestinus]